MLVWFKMIRNGISIFEKLRFSKKAHVVFRFWTYGSNNFLVVSARVTSSKSMQSVWADVK